MINKNITRHIGSRIRLKRKISGIGQDILANNLEISPQQLQKYESGTNRISANTLYKIAKILKTSPYFFFEGLEGIELNQNIPNDLRTVRTAYLISKIKNQKIKDKIISLIIELGS